MSSAPDASLDKHVPLARQYTGVSDRENAERNLELAKELNPNNARVFEAFGLVYPALASSRCQKINSARR